MFNDIELIIYDLDGTLIDGNKGIIESFRMVFEELGEPFHPQEVLSRIGVGLIEIFHEILPTKYHHDTGTLRDMYIRNFQSLGTDYIKTLPHVEKTLKTMKARGFKQSIATNKTSHEAQRILKALDLDKYLDLFAGFGTVDKVKPAPDMILYTLDKLHVSPRKTVFIDDTGIGLTAGLKAGVHTVGIATGNNTLEQIQGVNPSTIIHSLDKILEIIK